MFFSILGELRGRLLLAPVPSIPEFAKFGEDGLGNTVCELLVQAQAEGGPTEGSQWNVVAGQIDAFEAVDFLEIA
jgi:hypothetical protein